MKVLTIQDISCYGQCSTTVALPILSANGIETAILPSAILSTHTSGFRNFIVHDLTAEMMKIVRHWEAEKIKFDAIYTGFIGDVRQFEIILYAKNHLLKEGGLFIVDPAMADNGQLYPTLSEPIVKGMRDLIKEADLIIPNITEAAFLTGVGYRESSQNEAYVRILGDRLRKLGAKRVVMTSVQDKNLIGAYVDDGRDTDLVLKKKLPNTYHGSGDIFSSILIANYLKGTSLVDSADIAAQFICDAIEQTKGDKTHWYGLCYEGLLKNH